MTDSPRLLTALHDAGVRFIIVGGAAATAHGSARLTLEDLEVIAELEALLEERRGAAGSE